jgi:hypothetical protein
MVSYQIMMYPPIEAREKYFVELYSSITLEPTNCFMEVEVCKLELKAMMEAGNWKRQHLKLEA